MNLPTKKRAVAVRRATKTGSSHSPEPRVAGDLSLKVHYGRVGGGVVDDEELDVPERLGLKARDAARGVWRAVADRHDN